MLELEATIRNRLLFDSKAIKKIIKKLSLASSTTSQQQLQLDLSHLKLAIQKYQLIKKINAVQVDTFNNEQQEIQNDIEKAIADIEQLKIDIAQEKKVVENKLMYDVVCKDILKYSSRSSTEKRIQSLQKEIRNFKAEKIQLQQSKEARKKQFQVVVSSLTDLQELVALEKAKQETWIHQQYEHDEEDDEKDLMDTS